MRIAIVAVHGVIPQIRHGFQDEVAGTLRDALNAQKNGKTWDFSVVLPANGSSNVNDVPTISRVHASEPNPNAPAGDFFDVHEAYWSPIDKGKTNLGSVLAWLATTVFLPFNNFARYRENPIKVFWDIAYVSAAIAIGIGLIIASGLLAAEFLLHVLCLVASPADLASLKCSCPNYANRPPDLIYYWQNLGNFQAYRLAFAHFLQLSAFLLSPLTVAKTLSATVVAGLVVGALGSYLFWQVVRAVWFDLTNIAGFLQRDIVQLISRVLWTIALFLLAFFFLSRLWATPTMHGSSTSLGWVGLDLIVAVGAFNFGRSFLAWFVTNFFGDVQIYTTRNQNSDFFALRELILEKVVGTILGVLTTNPAGAPYDRVYIMAHSLGSTISMDALLRLYDVQAASANVEKPVLAQADWKRIRAFISFGTALEKTRYFFNVWSPTPSQEWEQWDAAVYGAVFTADKTALEAPDASAGIYWHNEYFFSDFVSDQICTYLSFLRPGESVSQNAEKIREVASNQGETHVGRLVAFNRFHFGPFPIGMVGGKLTINLQTHTTYLGTDSFWQPKSAQDYAVINVVTTGCTSLLPTEPSTRPVTPLSRQASPLPARSTPIPQWKRFLYKSWEIAQPDPPERYH